MCEQIKLEVRIMYSLNHEHIIKLYNHFEDNDYFYLIVEYAPKGQLYDELKKVKRFLEVDAAQYMREVVSAVQYLHSLNPPVIHRDIKPENILLDTKNSAKLCDFGWSNFFNPTRERFTYCGTPDYLSPEMIKQAGHDQRLDIWNLGVLLFEMLTGRPPFEGRNQKELFDNIKNLRISYPKDFPKLAKDLVAKLLKPNPKDRLSLEELLTHPWFTGKPLLRPILTKEIEMEKALPKADQDLEEKEYEAVSKVSKINREEERKSKASLLTETYKDLTTVKKITSEKDELINTLCEQLKSQKEEFNKQKVILENQVNELKAVRKENEDLRKHLGVSEKGYMSTEKLEIRKLSEELNKLKAVNKDREEVIEELNTTKETLTEVLTNKKILENELEVLKEAKKYSEDKVNELNDKLEMSEKKYAKVKQELEKAKLAIEKVKAEYEAEINELKYKIPEKGMQSTIEPRSMEIMSSCNKLLESLKKKVDSEMNYKKSEELAKSDLINERSRFNDLRKKYETTIAECAKTIADSMEEIRSKYNAEKNAEISKRDKIIEELKDKLSNADIKELKVKTESNNTKTLQKQNQNYQRLINDLRVQVALFSKEQKYLKDSLNEKTARIQDLEMEQQSSKKTST
jgi:serine/threonine protein kinase